MYSEKRKVKESDSEGRSEMSEGLVKQLSMNAYSYTSLLSESTRVEF